MVRRFSREGGKPRQFLVLLRRCQYDGQIAVAAKHDQLSAGQQYLAVIVTLLFPPPRPRFSVDAGEDVFIQPIDVPAPEDRTGEFVLEVLIPPHLACRECFSGWGNFNRDAAGAVSGGQEKAVRRQ